MGRHRGSFACLPAPHLLLGSPVPNRLRTGGGDPCCNPCLQTSYCTSHGSRYYGRKETCMIHSCALCTHEHIHTVGVYTFAVLCLSSPTAGQGVLWSLCEIFCHVLSTNSTGLWFGNGESRAQTLETVGWYGQSPWAWAIAIRPAILILVNPEAQQLPTLAFGLKKNIT